MIIDDNRYFQEKVFSNVIKKKLKEYCDEVIKNNTSINLISKNTEDTIWNRHIIDSAQVVDIIPNDEDGKKLRELYKLAKRKKKQISKVIFRKSL